MALSSLCLISAKFPEIEFLEDFCQKQGACLVWHMRGKEALKALSSNPSDIILLDFSLPDVEGLTYLQELTYQFPKSLVIVLMDLKQVQKATDALKLGIRDCILKPITKERLKSLLEKLFAETKKQQPHTSFESPIAASASMQKILREAQLIAKSQANVFIHGESGSGKEVIAEYIHLHSDRAAHPFIKVNCAAIPDTLIESEFFGHEKGAFTGAMQKRLGRFELAHNGTLLLDEISEIPLSVQPKLLRIIQEREFERLGSETSQKVDVRLISTSNRPMVQAIEEKSFREDLYFRLNVIPIFLPPLRRRLEDVIPLAEHFLAKTCLINQKSSKYLTEDAKKKLLEYHWPGNVRELSNVIERAVIMTLGDSISASCLTLLKDPSSLKDPIFQETAAISEGEINLKTLEEVEKSYIQHALALCQNNKTRAAKALNISVRTLRNKLKT